MSSSWPSPSQSSRPLPPSRRKSESNYFSFWNFLSSSSRRKSGPSPTSFWVPFFNGMTSVLAPSSKKKARGWNPLLHFFWGAEGGKKWRRIECESSSCKGLLLLWSCAKCNEVAGSIAFLDSATSCRMTVMVTMHQTLVMPLQNGTQKDVGLGPDFRRDDEEGKPSWE